MKTTWMVLFAVLTAAVPVGFADHHAGHTKPTDEVKRLNESLDQEGYTNLSQGDSGKIGPEDVPGSPSPAPADSAATEIHIE